MNCLEIQKKMTESSSFSKLSKSAQNHVEGCDECQDFYSTKPALKSLLFDALPDLEPDPRLLATVRQSVYREMDRPARSFLQWNFWPSLSFASGVAALVAVMALPMLWMDASRPGAAHGQDLLARAERVQVQTSLVGPFGKSENPLVVTDPLTSLNREYRPQIQPGSVVHVIYPVKQQKKAQRAVVHY
jgi:hypothetical protein